MYEIPFGAPTGWICPKCGRVYSPSTPTCFVCSGKEVNVITTDHIINDKNWWERYEKQTTADMSEWRNIFDNKIHKNDEPNE